MRKRFFSVISTACLTLAGVAGCSLIFDPDELALGGGPDGATDGGALVDVGELDATPPDADPLERELEIRPGAVFEGAGSSGTPIPVVFSGPGFAPDLSITSSAELVAIESWEVSSDGSMAAARLRVAVDEELDRGDSRIVTLTLFQQNDGWSDEVDLEVVGLNELSLEGSYSVRSDTFDALYSRIVTEGRTELTGGSAARLVATGSIAISHDLVASGGLRVDGDGDRVPGAGGCEGGAAGNDGDCGEAGGKGASDSGSGGGGGGHDGPGDDGHGDDSGGGGARAGNALLSPLGGDSGDDDGGARGHGGGGGHAATLGEAGRGGHGGGVIEVSAWGDVVIGAEVIADGEDGARGGTGIATCWGGGGGGSGGALLVRAGGELQASGGALLARGGQGGLGRGDGCDSDGGNGAIGRIRVDVPGRELVSGLEELEPAPARGPMWEAVLPAIVQSSPLSIDFIAEPGVGQYAVTLDDTVSATATPEINGRGTFEVSFESAGLYEVCLLVPQAFDRTRPESKNCRDVAYLP